MKRATEITSYFLKKPKTTGRSMVELNFRIILVLKQELNPYQKSDLIRQVESVVEACGLSAVSVCHSQAKKSDDEDYPEIEEFSLDVRGTTANLNIPKAQLCEEFCLKWKRNSNSLPYCSYVGLYSNDSFVDVKHPHQKIGYESFAFGSLPHNGKFYQFKTFQPHNEYVDFCHNTRNVAIEYSSYELTFSLENIRNIFISIQSKPSHVFFDLFNPPIIFRQTGRRRSRTLSVIDLSFNCNNLFAPNEINLPDPPPPMIDFDIFGRSNVLLVLFNDDEKVHQMISAIHCHYNEKAIYYSHITIVPKPIPADPTVENMHFECIYLITALFKRNFVLVSQATDINVNLQRLRYLSQQDHDALEKALTSLLYALDSGKILDFWHAIERQYEYYRLHKDEISFKDYTIPSKCSMIRRIILTPTRQLLWPKEMMLSNRVLRNFDSEYSVRVSFREDNMNPLSFTAIDAELAVLNSCITRPMTHGIRIGSRNYEFLAWSNSQLRDHGVWMYAEDEVGNTAAGIRAWMGDFSHIHNVPKYMSRMGQCFSQTEDTLSVPLDQRHVITENDIEGGFDIANGGKPYCFTDGIGRISSDLAAKIHNALGHDKLCSAFQIRYSGCKGMLVTDPTLKDAQMVLRQSMVKFDCPNSTRLEIARTSKPSPLRLNRPFITILNGLGVRHRVFLRLQEEMLKTLTDMLFDENEAARFLQSKTPASLYNYPDLSAVGIHLTTEPFFKSLLLALHRHYIEKIKQHANVSIDPSQGRNMLGVVDETNSLLYGEVFVQYTKDLCYGETTKDTIIHTGEVLVTTNPCMYPGDVRKFRAVDVPALRHIVDCIVFPQQGPRPHPNEMAGSDLDGDEYAVLWNHDLIFHGDNKKAADFPVVNCPDVPNVSVEHMIRFLQDYIKNDQVGAIASAHLAQADKMGIFSEECKSIAKKFSIAIDFPKNGATQRLLLKEKPREYPDFMESDRHKMYRSTNALGKMYRVCKDFESENSLASADYENIMVDPDLVYPGWEKYKENAKDARNKYNTLFRSVLRHYGIQHEAEALSGAFTNLHSRFQERRDRHEVKKVILGCLKKLNSCMQDEFMEEFLDLSDVAAIQEAMLQKASAWYITTYSDPNAKFLSFAWTVSRFLTDIKLKRTLGNPAPFSPMIMVMDEKILDFQSKGLLPPCAVDYVGNDYEFLCEKELFKRALRTLILWGQEEDIIERPGHSEGLLFLSVFVRLFFHVSEKVGYVARINTFPNPIQKKNYSAAHLCLEFLKFCSTFRFYTKDEMEKLLPFGVFKYSKIGKRAIVTYHNFALSGTFKTLNYDKSIEELIRMRPFSVDSSIFSKGPVAASSLRKAEEILKRYSKVQEINLHEYLQTRKVGISAKGTEEAIKELKCIMRKNHEFLRRLLYTGVMPVT